MYRSHSARGISGMCLLVSLCDHGGGGVATGYTPSLLALCGNELYPTIQKPQPHCKLVTRAKEMVKGAS